MVEFVRGFLSLLDLPNLPNLSCILLFIFPLFPLSFPRILFLIHSVRVSFPAISFLRSCSNSGPRRNVFPFSPFPLLAFDRRISIVVLLELIHFLLFFASNLPSPRDVVAPTPPSPLPRAMFVLDRVDSSLLRWRLSYRLDTGFSLPARRTLQVKLILRSVGYYSAVRGDGGGWGGGGGGGGKFVVEGRSYILYTCVEICT